MNRITNYLEEHYPHDLDKILLADGFEDAFMGVVESFGTAPKACYDYQKCIEILTSNFDTVRHTLTEGDVEDEVMTYNEAVEYLEFNVTQAYVGEHTPAFINVMEDKERKL